MLRRSAASKINCVWPIRGPENTLNKGQILTQTILRDPLDTHPNTPPPLNICPHIIYVTFSALRITTHVVAFHPRPQIASDLGRNVTRSFNPHRNRNQFPSGNEVSAYGRTFKSQPASTRCDLRIASPTRPFLQGS